MRNKSEITNWILLIMWMVFIYMMSNQPATVSDAQSGGVILFLSKIGIDMNSIFGDIANFIIRKSAHFLEYVILALLVLNLLNKNLNTKHSYAITIVFVFLYACSDEIHQLFVPGREGAIRDVIIDTCGGITLILIKTIISKLNILNK